MPQKINKQQGQGMVEYKIIVTLVALASIAAFSFFGQTVRDQTAQISTQVAGGDGQSARANFLGTGGGSGNGSGKHCCGVRGNPPAPMVHPES